MVNVTKTFLPDLDIYVAYLKKIWDKEWLTNRGELIVELENRLKDYLKIDNIIVMNNGTIPLQIALKLLGNGGEIITTPFSYIATTSSIIWENCSPIFVDITPDFLTIDESKIEQVITKKTTCILATHVFGNPCNIFEIEKIAKKYNLHVIYDGAHSFGVQYENKSIFEYGDITTCSFHATKLFHTGEGGALFTKDINLFKKAYYSHNFGHNGPTEFIGLGINGKNSELHAAMGLSILPRIDEIIETRKEIISYYLDNLNLDIVEFQKIRKGTNWNYSYLPVIFKNEMNVLAVLEELKAFQIYPRRYFYPSLNKIDYVSGESMPISESISSRILCLPLYFGLERDKIDIIIKAINKACN
jgi:dTDP-4-amino-4,6-dideoxygalactose transaminase